MQGLFIIVLQLVCVKHLLSLWWVHARLGSPLGGTTYSIFLSVYVLIYWRIYGSVVLNRRCGRLSFGAWEIIMAVAACNGHCPVRKWHIDWLYRVVRTSGCSSVVLELFVFGQSHWLWHTGPMQLLGEWKCHSMRSPWTKTKPKVT